MKNKLFREYQSGLRQASLLEEAEREVERNRLRARVDEYARAVGWTHDDVDQLSREVFGYSFIALDNRQLAELVSRLQTTMKLGENI